MRKSIIGPSIILSLISACAEVPGGPAYAPPAPPHYGCQSAVQDINEVQRISPSVPWGCAINFSIDMTCVVNRSDDAYKKITTDDDRRHFQNLASCINRICHKPAGAGWLVDSCATEAFTGSCEREQILCFGD